MDKELFGSWKTTPAKECLQTGEVATPETLFHFRANAREKTDTLIQMDEVTDVICGNALYDTLARNSKFEPWQYAGQCFKGENVNRNPALMPMVYLCSAFRAETPMELAEHIEVAKQFCRQIADGGAIPIAPHLYFPRFMDDNTPAERWYGMGAGKRLMDCCSSFHVVIVDGVISEGMEQEIFYMTERLGLYGTVDRITHEQVQELMKRKMEM